MWCLSEGGAYLRPALIRGNTVYIFIQKSKKFISQSFAKCVINFIINFIIIIIKFIINFFNFITLLTLFINSIIINFIIEFVFINNSNIDASCLSKSKLHFNRKGTSYLANNFIKHIFNIK